MDWLFYISLVALVLLHILLYRPPKGQKMSLWRRLLWHPPGNMKAEKTSTKIATIAFCVLVILFAWLVFTTTDKGLPVPEGAPDTGPELDPYVPIPPGRVSHAENTEVRAAIEKAFQILVETPVGSDDYMQVLRAVVPVAQQVPEVIVEKLRTGDKETRRRAIGVMYNFRRVKDTSLLVRALVDLYRESDIGMQACILTIFGQAHAVPALPFLRQVLDDTRPQPPPPPNIEPPVPPIRMCDTAFHAVARILESLGYKQFMHIFPHNIEKMKKWLDSHPEIVDPSGKWKARHDNETK